jgi:selenocysteine-specific elongation factor
MKNILKNVEEYCISDKIVICKLEEIYESFSGKEIEQILEWMLATGKLIKIDDEMVMHENHYNKAKELLVQFITKNNEISLAEFRDLSGISRKQAEKLLDKFDKERVTIRKGDIRILV